MRYQGRVVKWLDHKSYGFIKSADKPEQIFVHVSAFPASQSRPKVNELVTFDIAEGAKGEQAYNVLYVNRAQHVVKPTRFEMPTRKKNYSSLIIMVIFGFLVLNLMPLPKLNIPETHLKPSEPFISRGVQINEAFQCSGKSKCNEMTSCDEAIYYLRYCPGTIMDGDGDGLPCEDQWCRN